MADQPRVIRNIAVGYELGQLPGPWLQVFHRFEHSISRAGLKIRVHLAPLEDLPEDGFDILVVPPKLQAAAEKVADGALVLTSTAAESYKLIARVLEDLKAGIDLKAELADPNEPRIVRYRGFLPI